MPVHDRGSFENLYAGQPRWEIGRPQQAILEVADRITGSVLDAGCGSDDSTFRDGVPKAWFVVWRGGPDVRQVAAVVQALDLVRLTALLSRKSCPAGPLQSAKNGAKNGVKVVQNERFTLTVKSHKHLK
jgi:hypothetical protein